MTMQEQVIVQPQFDQVYWIKNGVVKVTKDRKSGMLDSLGRIYYSGLCIKSLVMNFIMVCHGSPGREMGFIDSTGQTQVPFQFDEVRRFEKKISPGPNGKINMALLTGMASGWWNLSMIFVDHYWTSIGQIKVMKGKKFGFVNESASWSFLYIWWCNGVSPTKRALRKTERAVDVREKI